jgi:GT2 family glycosyltransferase
MFLSAVICTHNRADLIARAVSSVLANDHDDFELVVLDQSSSDATKRALESLIERHSNLHYMHTTRVGLSAAYNAAIAGASGEILAFTDDDCVVPADWLTRIETAFESEPSAQLLYGQVLTPPELQGAEGILPTWEIARREIIARGEHFRVCGMGANFAARRRLFEQIGGFDEVLGGGGPLCSTQDFDLQYRVYRAGLTTLLDPEVKLDHYGIRPYELWPQTLTAYGIGVGGFYMKHARCGDARAAWLVTKTIVHSAAAAIYKQIVARNGSTVYLEGILRGLYRSFSYRIDRERRMYIVPSLPANSLATQQG